MLGDGKGVKEVTVKFEAEEKAGATILDDEFVVGKRKDKSPWSFNQSRKSVHLFLLLVGRKDCTVLQRN